MTRQIPVTTSSLFFGLMLLLLLDRASGEFRHALKPAPVTNNRVVAGAARREKPIEQTASFPQASATQLDTQRDLASRPGVKLSVKHEGWYRVTKEELVAKGFGANTDPRLLQMCVDGREIPISVVTQNGADGLPSYAVEFYGIGLDSAVTDTRVYWLAESSIPGARIGQVKPRGQKRADASFPFTVERRDRNIYFSSLTNGERENFFGAVVTQHPVSQTVALQNLAQSTRKTALLEVALQGITDSGHQVSLNLNGVSVRDLRWSDGGVRHEILKFKLLL